MKNLMLTKIIPETLFRKLVLAFRPSPKTLKIAPKAAKSGRGENRPMTEKESQSRKSYRAFGTIPRKVLEEASRAFTFFSLSVFNKCKILHNLGGNEQRKKTNRESHGLQMKTCYYSSS